MRDLEIRGAGNLLGKEQSGSIGAVGFELFTDLLREAVCQLRGDDEALTSDHVGSIDPEVKIPLDAFIPEPYIPDVAERLLLYQRLAMILESHEADEILNELRDRFGDPDEEVVNLVHVMSYRGLLRRFGIAKAEVVGLNLTLSLTQSSPLDPQALISLTKINPHMYKLGRNLSLIVKFAEENSDINSLYRFTEQLLNSLRPESKESNKCTRGAGVVTNQLTSLGESFERDQKHGTQW
jgi:transcription-repair coupling factor (superfamily II helicase)